MYVVCTAVYICNVMKICILKPLAKWLKVEASVLRDDSEPVSYQNETSVKYVRTHVSRSGSFSAQVLRLFLRNTIVLVFQDLIYNKKLCRE